MLRTFPVVIQPRVTDTTHTPGNEKFLMINFDSNVLLLFLLIHSNCPWSMQTTANSVQISVQKIKIHGRQGSALAIHHMDDCVFELGEWAWHSDLTEDLSSFDIAVSEPFDSMRHWTAACDHVTNCEGLPKISIKIERTVIVWSVAEREQLFSPPTTPVHVCHCC